MDSSPLKAASAESHASMSPILRFRSLRKFRRLIGKLNSTQKIENTFHAQFLSHSQPHVKRSKTRDSFQTTFL